MCYAISDYPDRDYKYGGTLVDIGDIFLNGRTEEHSVNALGNTHGGIECCNGQWYVFYHRQTNETQFSRQACAEKIYFDENGMISQVEVTSCGLNQGPLKGEGTYPAYIACHLTKDGKNVMSLPAFMKDGYPYFTQDIGDCEPSEELNKQDREFPIQYIHNIFDKTCIGFKYFDFQGVNKLTMVLRGQGNGVFKISTTPDGPCCGEVSVQAAHGDWKKYEGTFEIKAGMHAFYLTYEGDGMLEFAQFTLRE